MPEIDIRVGVDEETHRKLRVEAAERRITLKDLVREKLRGKGELEPAVPVLTPLQKLHQRYLVHVQENDPKNYGIRMRELCRALGCRKDDIQDMRLKRMVTFDVVGADPKTIWVKNVLIAEMTEGDVEAKVLRGSPHAPHAEPFRTWQETESPSGEKRQSFNDGSGAIVIRAPPGDGGVPAAVVQAAPAATQTKKKKGRKS